MSPPADIQVATFDDKDMGAPSSNIADKPTVIVAVILLWTFGFLFLTTLPIYLGGAADTFGFSPAQIGFLGSGYFAGFMLPPLAVAAWLPRVDWRVATLLSGTISVAACLATLATGAYGLLLGSLFVLGVGCGSINTIVYRILGAATNVDRVFGIANLIALVLQAALVLVFTNVVSPRYGFSGFTVALAVALAVMLIGTVWVPPSGQGMGKTSARNAQGTLSVSIMASQGAMLALYVGTPGMWAFTERIGADAGFRPEAIGQLVAGAMLVVGFGSLIAAVQATRWGRLWPMAAGCLMIIAGFFASVAAADFAPYVLAVLAWCFAWGYVLTFSFGVIADTDPGGRFVGATAAGQGIGMATGPALAGLVISNGNFFPVAVLCSIAIGTCFAFAAASIALERR